MKLEQVVQELEDVARQLGLRVRWERGNFRGGRCTVNGEELVVLNRRHPVEVHLAILAESLRELPVDTVFMRPAVREALEDAWLRQVAFDVDSDGEA